jgi:hypothetical protein
MTTFCGPVPIIMRQRRRLLQTVNGRFVIVGLQGDSQPTLKLQRFVHHER